MVNDLSKEKAGSSYGTVGESTFHVRYAETDQMGIVHHSAYPIWFEEGRSSFARQVGWPYSRFERDGLALAVSQLNVRYLASTQYDRKVTIRTRITQVRSRLMRFDYEALDTDSGQVLALGYTIHICVNRQGRPQRIPDEWRDFWQSLVSESGGD